MQTFEKRVRYSSLIIINFFPGTEGEIKPSFGGAVD